MSSKTAKKPDMPCFECQDGRMTLQDIKDYDAGVMGVIPVAHMVVCDKCGAKSALSSEHKRWEKLKGFPTRRESRWASP